MNASTQWNSVCANFHFPTTTTASITGTFASEYYGEDFESDFPLALQATAELCGMPAPSFSGEDLLRQSIENWPDG